MMIPLMVGLSPNNRYLQILEDTEYKSPDERGYAKYRFWLYVDRQPIIATDTMEECRQKADTYAIGSPIEWSAVK
jgi:hypothetical protein